MSPKKIKEAPSATVAELPFEQAYAELAQIVQQLESGALALDESLALFERGQALAARCQTVLENATLKLQTLTPSGGLAPFEIESVA